MAYTGADGSAKKMLKLAICAAAIILGVYMTYFHHYSEEKWGDSEQMTEINGSDYSNMKLPESNNTSMDEVYSNDGVVSSIYFSNTNKLDQGNLPLEAQAVLVQEAQAYLNLSGFEDVTELYLYEESYMESDEKISFICFMDGHREALQIEYFFSEKCLKYYILPDGVNEENG